MISFDQQKGPSGKCQTQLAAESRAIGSPSQAIDFNTKIEEKAIHSLKEDSK